MSIELPSHQVANLNLNLQNWDLLESNFGRIQAIPHVTLFQLFLFSLVPYLSESEERIGVWYAEESFLSILEKFPSSQFVNVMKFISVLG